MTLKDAKEIVGGIGHVSKMPGTSYGLSATACVIGSKLRKVVGSTCAQCYAMRANYLFVNSRQAHAKRLASLSHPQWVDAMATLINHYTSTSGQYYHRWHDSGDLQHVAHLESIIAVCRKTPRVRHWLPTRETGIVRKCRKRIPRNLIIRISATMVDGELPKGPHVSGVYKTRKYDAWHCPAHEQGNVCGDCHACWDKRIRRVVYPKH